MSFGHSFVDDIGFCKTEIEYKIENLYKCIHYTLLHIQFTICIVYKGQRV